MKKIMTSADPFMKLIADMDKATRNTILHSRCSFSVPASVAVAAQCIPGFL